MPPKRAAKKAPAAKTAKATAAAAARQAKKEAETESLRQWIAENDPLLDPAREHPIKFDDIFTNIITRKTFAQPGAGQVPYDWSDFRTAVESRTANSPRWFVQLREEDLLAGADGMDGVTVNCFVIAETAEPTLAPAEYVVKVHWPYSDAEDNAPERILPIAGQGMCWRRVVKNDGSDVNMYLLQKRTAGAAPGSNGATGGAGTTAASFGFGAPAATSATSSSAPASGSAVPPSFGFGFGNAAPAVNTAAPAAPVSFGFGFGSNSSSAQPSSAAAPAAFGFGSAPAAPATAPANFGFGAAPSSPTPAAPPASPVAFAGAGATNSAPATAPDNNDDGSVKTQPLSTAEVLFCLWSKKRLTNMTQEVKSGSRIVREKFPLDANKSIKLVMENDRKDSVTQTVRRLLLNRIFAKQDEEALEVDKWINDCPVYDEVLTTALQTFREQHLNELADESEEFAKLSEMYSGKMQTELQRIIDIRNKAAQKELDAIEEITERIKEHKLAEKSSFRLLKYYPKNDVQKFRPFGKVSGISEMGETVDICVPPAHVNINPFTGKPS